MDESASSNAVIAIYNNLGIIFKGVFSFKDIFELIFGDKFIINEDFILIINGDLDILFNEAFRSISDGEFNFKGARNEDRGSDHEDDKEDEDDIREGGNIYLGEFL